MYSAFDSVLVLLLGICTLAFSARIARYSWQLNLRTGSRTPEEIFLRIYQAAGVVFIFCAVLMSLGVVPLK